jgi:hypothetical protein
MNSLEDMEANSIPITWKTVAIGPGGPGIAPAQIGFAEVESWLQDRLAAGGNQLEGTIDVLIAITQDAEAGRLISELESVGELDIESEICKWQWTMLLERTG